MSLNIFASLVTALLVAFLICRSVLHLWTLLHTFGFCSYAICPVCLTPKLVYRRSHLSISPLTPSPLSLWYYSRVLVLVDWLLAVPGHESRWKFLLQLPRLAQFVPFLSPTPLNWSPFLLPSLTLLTLFLSLFVGLDPWANGGGASVAWLPGSSFAHHWTVGVGFVGWRAGFSETLMRQNRSRVGSCRTTCCLSISSLGDGCTRGTHPRTIVRGA